MRWYVHCLSAVVVAVGIAAPVLAQVDPNQPPNIVQQLQQNMNNAGVTPRDIIQSVGQQMQDGTFDPQAFRQQLQDSGIINQGMLDQLQQTRNQIQQQQQNRQMVSLQQLLNSPDDEWAVLNVKIQRILDLNTDLGQTSVVVTQRGGGGFGGGAGGGGGGPQSAAQGPVAKALQELKLLLQDPNTPETEVAAKLSAFRDVRKHALADLDSARSDLLALVTLRQEAILLNMNILN